MGLDLKKDVLLPVAKRLKKRADSLKQIKRFPKSGIEGWLKVEVVSVLGNKIIKLQNKGPDLLFTEDTQIEIKAATDFNLTYLRDGALKYNSPCLFLGDGSDKSRINQLANGQIELIGYDVFSDGASDWVIGIIIPSKSDV